MKKTVFILAFLIASFLTYFSATNLWNRHTAKIEVLKYLKNKYDSTNFYVVNIDQDYDGLLRLKKNFSGLASVNENGLAIPFRVHLDGMGEIVMAHCSSRSKFSD